MALNQRERYIAYGVGAALGLLVLNYFIVDPYLSARSSLQMKLAAAQKQDFIDQNLFLQQRHMKRVWSELEAGGLKSDPADAESQMLKALSEWANDSGVKMSSLRPEQQKPDGRFLQVTFQMSGSGPTAAASKLLWRIETATMPVRVNEVQLRPVKENIDELQIQISVSTLCLLPDDKDKDKGLGGRAVTSLYDARGDRP